MANRSRRAVESPTGSTTEPEFELTDEQWQLISDLFPEPPETRGSMDAVRGKRGSCFNMPAFPNRRVAL